MKFRNYSATLVIVLLLILCAGSTEMFAQGAIVGLNRIEGRVTDESNNGVDNAYIELYDNYGTLISRQRSLGQGRFSFRGMRQGRYVISVKPYGTNLKEESKEIEINNQSSRSDTVMVDFRLLKDKTFQQTDAAIVGTIFAQEVPEEAKRLYKSGVDEVQSKPDKARDDLKAAINIFPKYFDALEALGKADIIQGKYSEGYPYLLRAIDVNSRCSDCYYSLSIAFYKLNELVAAVKAVDAAAILQPKSGPVRLLQGMIYRNNNDLAGAEKSLLLAKSLFTVPNPEVHWQLSNVYNRQKRNQEAADELELYIKAKSDMNAAEKASVRDLIAKLRKTK